MKNINKDLQEELPEVSEVKEATVEDTLNNKKPKKEKKHSNAKVMVRFLLGAVAVCMIVMIATGAWNPFKSTTTEKEAVELYEKSEEVADDLWASVGFDNEIEDTDPTFGKNGTYPYGFTVDDYGEDGKDGCLKKMFSSSYSYDEKYGLKFTVYYMKNNDYAQEKYLYLKSVNNNRSGYTKETTTKKGNNVFIHYDQQADYIFVIVKNGTIVYDMYTSPLTELSKAQPLFDKLGIDFQIPSIDEIK